MIRYISKGDWFVAGSEAILIDDYRPQINAGLFSGLRQKRYAVLMSLRFSRCQNERPAEHLFCCADRV